MTALIIKLIEWHTYFVGFVGTAIFLGLFGYMGLLKIRQLKTQYQCDHDWHYAEYMPDSPRNHYQCTKCDKIKWGMR
jgi:hypothetical protein